MQLRRGRKYNAPPAKTSSRSRINRTSKTPPSVPPLALQSDLTDCKVLSIAPELRNAIYEYALCEEDPIEIDRHNFAQPALLRTCKTIRAEASSIYYYLNQFDIETIDFDSSVALAWYGHSHRYYNHKTANVALYSRLTLSSWSNLSKWLRLFYDRKLILHFALDKDDLKYPTAGRAFKIVKELWESWSTWETVENVLEHFKQATDSFMHWVEDYNTHVGNGAEATDSNSAKTRRGS